MIKLIGKTDEKVCYHSSYTPESYAFNIEFEVMNDDNIIDSARVTNTSMMWIIEGNMIGEIELLSPKTIDYGLYIIDDKVEVLEALPLVEIYSQLQKTAFVELSKEKFTIWFEDKLKIDKKYIYQDLVFYVSGNQIVAIEANNYETIIY